MATREELAARLRKEALEIFDGPETAQDVRDAIEWFAAALATLEEAAQPAKALSTDEELVATKGTTAIVDAWNALPNHLRLSPYLYRLYEAVKTCRDVDAPDPAQPEHASLPKDEPIGYLYADDKRALKEQGRSVIYAERQRFLILHDPGCVPLYAGAPPATSEERRDAERMADALHQIKQWAQAYPLDVFPEPDLKRAHEVLKAAGMTLDAISAHNMRHVITKVQAIADAAIDQARGKA